jgi:uncharacterized protein (TIGR02996 family)
MAKKRAKNATPPHPPPARQALEAALAADPDDLGAHMAYADWLTEQGDPRGEFIQVQLALEDPSRRAEERERLRQREQVLRQAHEREWLGDLAPYLIDQRDVRGGRTPQRDRYRHLLARGWLDTLHVEWLTVSFAQMLARSREARLLRRLTVFQTSDPAPDEGTEREQSSGPYLPGLGPPAEEEGFSLAPLRDSPYLTNVRFFHLGLPVDETSRHRFNSRLVMGTGAAEVIERMPRVEELHLFIRGLDTEWLFGLGTLQHLRVLQVYHLLEYPLARLAANPALRQLTHLLLHPAWLEYQGAYRREDVRALLSSPHLVSLRHLQLRLSDLGDRLCDDLVASGILKRLDVLDLQHGTITDAGARALAACPDLHHLDRLLIADNALGQAGVAALRGTGIRVEAGAQHDTDDVDWTYEGDME